jgi:anti-anti-sigma factor
MLVAENAPEILAAPNRLVAETRLDFRRAVLEHLERVAQLNAARVVIDLRHTTDIDASGLGVLVLLQKRARERMIATKLLHPPASVKQMIALTRLDYLFEMED